MAGADWAGAAAQTQAEPALCWQSGEVSVVVVLHIPGALKWGGRGSVLRRLFKVISSRAERLASHLHKDQLMVLPELDVQAGPKASSIFPFMAMSDCIQGNLCVVGKNAQGNIQGSWGY